VIYSTKREISISIRADPCLAITQESEFTLNRERDIIAHAMIKKHIIVLYFIGKKSSISIVAPWVWGSASSGGRAVSMATYPSTSNKSLTKGQWDRTGG
jgi:hypothetical protein